MFFGDQAENLESFKDTYKTTNQLDCQTYLDQFELSTDVSGHVIVPFGPKLISLLH